MTRSKFGEAKFTETWMWLFPLYYSIVYAICCLSTCEELNSALQSQMNPQLEKRPLTARSLATSLLKMFFAGFKLPWNRLYYNKTVFHAMLQIVHYFEDIYDTVSSFVRWNSISDNPGQNTSGYLSNFGRKVENLLYMLPSLYEQRVFLFRCLFRAPLPPRQFWNMLAINERILILEIVKNQQFS